MTRAEPTGTVAAVIPARLASTRFPGKPLVDIAGQAMIAHVVRRASMARTIGTVVVATDDERIADAARAAGAMVVMTSPDHRSGSDRVAEAAAGLSAELLINIQGDQPLLEPDGLDRMVERHRSDPTLGVTTLATPIRAEEEWLRPDVVKVAVSERGDAVYFSRSPIPFSVERKGGLHPGALKHIGVYGFRRDVLLAYAGWPPSPLERAESLEQLRLLEHGVRIGVIEVGEETVSVDRPEDVARVEAILAGREPPGHGVARDAIGGSVRSDEEEGPKQDHHLNK